MSREKISEALKDCLLAFQKKYSEKESYLVGDACTDAQLLIDMSGDVLHFHGVVAESDMHFLSFHAVTRENPLSQYIPFLVNEKEHRYIVGNFLPKLVQYTRFSEEMGKGFHIPWNRSAPAENLEETILFALQPRQSLEKFFKNQEYPFMPYW
ncbi:hypothetical protein J4424_06060 [Candidatus Woesearchaeota archaeon]|nr:hypothetical protein [Candidatus Woesearchaeota archaeon]